MAKVVPTPETATRETTAITPRPPAPIAMRNDGRGVVLRTVEELYRFAQLIYQSGMAPQGFKNPQALVVAIELGVEVGLGPMTAIQNIAVINGKPSLFGDVQMGLVQASGLFDNAAYKEWTEGKWPDDGYTCFCQVKRINAANPVIGEFSIGDAKKARLWGKTGPWSDYPKRQQMWRARGWALRDCFPDVLKGMYSVAEAQDVPVIIEVGQPQTQPGQSQGDALAAQLAAKPADPAAQPKPKETDSGSGDEKRV